MDPNEQLRRTQINHESCKSDTQKEIYTPEESCNAGLDLLRNTHDDNDFPNVENNPNVDDTTQNVEDNPSIDDTPQNVEDNPNIGDNLQRLEENPNIDNIVKLVAENSVSDKTEKYLTKSVSSDNTEQQVANNPSSNNTEKPLAENTISDISAQNVTGKFSRDNSTKNVVAKLIREKKKQNIVRRKNKQTQTDNISAFNSGKHKLGVSAGDSTMQHQLGNSCESANKKVKTEHCDRGIYRQHEVESIGIVQCKVNQNNFQSSFDNPTDTIGLNKKYLSGKDMEKGKINSRIVPCTPENSHTYQNNQHIIHGLRRAWLLTRRALVAGVRDLLDIMERDRQRLSLLHGKILDELYVPHDEIRRMQRFQYFRNRSKFLHRRRRRLEEILQLVLREIPYWEETPGRLARRVRILNLLTQERNRENDAMETYENDQNDTDDSEVTTQLFITSYNLSSTIIFFVLLFVNLLLWIIMQ